jgi:hypothetical protein
MRLNRVTPQLPAHSFTTFAVAAPFSTHWVYITCDEADCAGWRYGFHLDIDERTDQGMMQAAYLRDDGIPEATPAAAAAHVRHTRRYTESRTELGLTRFAYPAGTRCFQEHKRRGDRPELFLVKGGDWRGNPRGIPTRQHVAGAHWVEEFADHQDRLAAAQQKG